jgi:hypothetical protein
MVQRSATGVFLSSYILPVYLTALTAGGKITASSTAALKGG